MVDSQYYTCHCRWSLKPSLFIKPLLSFWFCSICSVRLGFLLCLHTLLIWCCYVVDLKSLYSVALLLSHLSNLFRLNHMEELSALMKNKCFSQDIVPTVGEGSVINNSRMHLDLLDANSPSKFSPPKVLVSTTDFAHNQFSVGYRSLCVGLRAAPRHHNFPWIHRSLSFFLSGSTNQQTTPD